MRAPCARPPIRCRASWWAAASVLALAAIALLATGATACAQVEASHHLSMAAPDLEADPRAASARVAVYGDSLVWEAQGLLSDQLQAEVPIWVQSFGGTALCDYTDQIVRESSARPSRLVVIGFTGNTYTPCMDRVGPSPTGEEIAAAYTEDLGRLLEDLGRAGTPVLLVGAPPSLALDGSTYWTSINQAWRDEADRRTREGADVTYADSGQALADPDGHWAATLPCLLLEDASRGCVDGHIRVRSDDRAHFCPELEPAREGVIQGCAVWNGGAWRYSAAIADAIRARLSS